MHLLLLAAAMLSTNWLAQSEQKVYVLDAIDGESLQLQRENGAVTPAHRIGIEAPGTRADKRHSSKLYLGSPARSPPEGVDHPDTTMIRHAAMQQLRRAVY